jgi:hypothetical protein
MYEWRNQDNRGPLVRHALGCIVFALFLFFSLFVLVELLLQVSTKEFGLEDLERDYWFARLDG